MHSDRKDETERVSRVVVAALAAVGVALLAAGGVGIYEASVERGHAVGEVVRSSTERQPDVTEYLPGSSLQIGALSEPLMLARRAALRSGFDRDDAPVDAFERLRSVPGHDDEARSLLAQFWERRAMLADDPVHRVLYALEARVVADDDSHRSTAASALASLGPLRVARHVAEGTVLWSDARLLVVRGSGWVHVVDQDTQASFDLPESDAASALVDGHRMLTWSGDTARIWDVDPGAPAPTAPAASLKLLAGEVPLSLSGDCVLTSAARVWRPGDGADVVTAARKRWTGGSVDPTCERVVLWGDAIASYRLRGKAWAVEATKAAGKGAKGPPIGKSGEIRVEACASQAPRCAIRDSADATGSASLASVWDLGVSPPRRLFDGIDCEAAHLSPDGTRVICREPQNVATLYGQDDAGTWSRTDMVLPSLAGAFLEDDGTVCGTVRRRASAVGDRSDVFFLAPHECWAPAAIERAWSSIRMTPTGSGAVFTFPPTAGAPSGNTEYLGFGAKGESLAAASNAWFGEGKDERLLEHDATNSAGEKSYELAGVPFDPSSALVPRIDPPTEPSTRVSSIQIDHAVFVEAPEPSLVFEVSYRKGSTAAGGAPLRAVARWDLRAQRFCGAAVAGALDGVAPGGDAVVIDGRIERVGACTPDRGFEPTDATDAVTVGPGGARWLSRDGDWLQVHGAPSTPSAVPMPVSRTEKGSASHDDARDGSDSHQLGRQLQLAFGPDGDRFFVKTADSLCVWIVRDDGTPDLDGCRWSTGGWASDAAWAADEKTGVKVVVFDRTAEGASLRAFFGGRENTSTSDPAGDLACNAPPAAHDAPLAELQRWEERLGHRFKDQAAPMQDTLDITSTEIVPNDVPPR